MTTVGDMHITYREEAHLFVEGVALEKLKQGDHAPSVPVLSEGGHQELWRVAEELAEGAPGQVSLLPR